ncbi:MAG: hypothetical protein ACRCV3_04040 [Desulfovibrionaceae bacterium]
MNRISPTPIRAPFISTDPPTPDYEPTFEINPLASEKALERSKKNNERIGLSVPKIEALQKLASTFMGRDLHKQFTHFIFTFEEEKRKKRSVSTIKKHSIFLSLFTEQENAPELEEREAILLHGDQKYILKGVPPLLENMKEPIFVKAKDTPEYHDTENITNNDTTNNKHIPILLFYFCLLVIFLSSFLTILSGIYNERPVFIISGSFFFFTAALCYFYYSVKNNNS